MSQIDMEKFRISFLEEATDLLEGANENILRAESASDPELFNAVFRSIHTIKGSAGGFGFDNMSEFSHHLETLMDKLRNGELTINADITDLLLRGIDTLFEMVDCAKENREFDKDLSELVSIYDNMTAGEQEGAAVAEETQEAEDGVSAPADIVDILKENHPGFGKPYKVEVRFTDEMLENGYDPLTLFANLREISDFYLALTDTGAVPASEDIEPYKLYLKPELYIISDASLEEINDLAFDPDVMEVHTVALTQAAESAQAEPEPVDEPAAEEPAEENGAAEEVSTEGLDRDMLREFAGGIEDYFESIENYLIDIEKTGAGSKDAVDNIFRVFHNIKGDSGYVGFSFMEKYAHLVENMLDKVREGAVEFDTKAAEFILNIISDVKGLIQALADEQTPKLPATYEMLKDLSNTMLEQSDQVYAITDDIKIFLGQVDQFLEMIDLSQDAQSGNQILKRAASGLKNASKFIGFKDLSQLTAEFESKVSGGKDHKEALNAIVRYIQQLKSPPKKLGELLVDSGKVTPEEIENAKAQQKKIGEILVDQGKLNKEDLDIVLKKQNVMKAAEKVHAKPEEEEAARDTAISKDKIPQSMKVDQEKIDKFTNTIGELVVAKNAYEYMVQKLIRDYDLPNSLIKDFKDNSNLIARISQDLQRDILSLRMVPIRQIFSKFPRVVRDISRKQNKQIELRIIGEDTEIDKKIADILSDPLVHLVRNACDHGLEGAQERTAAGKYEVGNIILKAYNEGSFVYVEVIDDGRGIDSEKVLKKAVSKGMVPSDASLTDKEIIQFILEPGFSTADKVTDISGRGVGMDVVKSSIISVGGFIDVSSGSGDGTRVTMKIPVTIGMSTSLLVRMGGDEYYAFPIENVAETIKAEKDQVKDLHFGKGIYYRGNVLPLFQLSKLLGGEDRELSDEVNIVVTATDAGKTGIIVDELLNRMDIAIKPVPEYFAHLNYIGGVTILGDGQAVLVLNVNKLF